MAFLTAQELHTVAPTDFINILKGTDETVVNEIIDESISRFTTYLGSYYDMETVFNQTEGDRNKTILSYLKKLVLYELEERRKPGGNEKTFEEIMNFLEKIASGDMKVDLPPKKVDTDGDGIADDEVKFMKLGSRKSYQNGW